MTVGSVVARSAARWSGLTRRRPLLVPGARDRGDEGCRDRCLRQPKQTLGGRAPLRVGHRCGALLADEGTAQLGQLTRVCTALILVAQPSAPRFLEGSRVARCSKMAAPPVTMPMDSSIDPRSSSGVCQSAPTTARAINRVQATPITNAMTAGSFSEQRVERQPHGQRRRAHCGDASGWEGGLSVVAPLDQRLGDVLAYEEGRGGNRRVDDDTKKASSGNAEGDGDDEGNTDRRDGQELGEVGPVRGRRRRPQPSESGVLESVRAVAVRHDQSQKREGAQARHGDDGEPGWWHGGEGIRRT